MRREFTTNLKASYRLVIKRLVYLLLIFCCAFSITATADNSAEPTPKLAPLNLGLIPHLSTNLLMKKYSNLINYLEAKLGRPVIVNTAPDFKTYMQRCAEGRFDLYMTAPHMATHHEKYNQHIRHAKFSNKLSSVVTVRKDSPYNAVKELKGLTISAPDSLAVNTINGEVTLSENGLIVETDVTIKYTTSNNNPLFLLAEGKVDAAITGLPVFKIVNKNPKLKNQLRILKTSNGIPHMMFMSPPGVSETERELFKNALLNMHKNDTGNAFLSGLPFGHLIEITDEDMQSLSGMLELLEKRLK